MTKTKKQLRAEAVERLKNCAAARFDAESIVIALTSGRHGQSEWSLECDKLIYLLADDANDDLAPEKVVSGSEPCVTPESCRQYADQRKQGDDADCESCDSREKLEADAGELTADYAASGEVCDALHGGIIALLDRQAEITKREWCDEQGFWNCAEDAVMLSAQVVQLIHECDELREKLGDTTEAISELMKKQPRTFDPHDVPGSLRLVGRYIDELELRLVGKPECDICDRTTLLEEVEGLTAERDNLKANNQQLHTLAGEQAATIDELTAERDELKELNEYHALQYELASEDADRLQAQVDGLQSKLAEYEDRSMQFASLAGGTLYVGTKALTERIAELYSDLVKASDEREHYREKCSKMATIIHDALMVMDEGMA